MAVPDAAAPGGKKLPITEIIPDAGRDRLGGHVDDRQAGAAPELRVHVDEVRVHAQVQAQQALVFGETPVNPKACPFMNKLQADSCAQYHLDEPLPYYDTIKFWKTPVADCGNGQ